MANNYSSTFLERLSKTDSYLCRSPSCLSFDTSSRRKTSFDFRVFMLLFLFCCKCVCSFLILQSQERFDLRLDLCSHALLLVAFFLSLHSSPLSSVVSQRRTKRLIPVLCLGSCTSHQTKTHSHRPKTQTTLCAKSLVQHKRFSSPTLCGACLDAVV